MTLASNPLDSGASTEGGQKKLCQHSADWQLLGTNPVLFLIRPATVALLRVSWSLSGRTYNLLECIGGLGSTSKHLSIWQGCKVTTFAGSVRSSAGPYSGLLNLVRSPESRTSIWRAGHYPRLDRGGWTRGQLREAFPGIVSKPCLLLQVGACKSRASYKSRDVLLIGTRVLSWELFWPGFFISRPQRRHIVYLELFKAEEF